MKLAGKKNTLPTRQKFHLKKFYARVQYNQAGERFLVEVSEELANWVRMAMLKIEKHREEEELIKSKNIKKARWVDVL